MPPRSALYAACGVSRCHAVDGCAHRIGRRCGCAMRSSTARRTADGVRSRARWI